MYGRYTLFALAPVLYNIGIIIGALLLYPKMGLVGLGWGVVLGALLHFGIQAPFFFVHGLSYRGKGPGLFVALKEVGSIMLTSIPRTLSLSFTSLAFLAIIAYAATLKPGSIALFTFAFNLAAAPLALIGVSYSVAAFPTLSRLYKESNHEEFVSHMLTAARHILFWSLPLTALCIVLRAHIVRAILGTGLFTWADTRIAAATFALFVLALAAQGITLLFVRGYYAAEKTLVPLVVTAITGVASVLLAIGLTTMYTANTTFAYFLHDLLRLAPRDDASIALLALGFSIASIMGALALVTIFSISFLGVGRQMGKAFRDGFVGAVFAGFGAYLATLGFAQVYDLSSLVQILFQGFVAGFAGITLSSLILYLIGNREVREVYAALHGHASKLSRIRVKGVEAHGE
jgi:putative peptidoglycan lipid II flippase